MNAGVERAVAAVTEGRLAVIPTDTVYGLACAPDDADAVAALSALKRRLPEQPIALVASSVGVLFERLPDLDGDGRAVALALLPGPYTLVFPDPARRFALLSGGAVGTIGVRVPAVAGVAFDVLEPLARSRRRARTSTAAPIRVASTTSPSRSGTRARPSTAASSPECRPR